MKRILSMFCVAALLIMLVPTTAKAAADGATWTKVSGETWVLQDGQGTDLQAKLDENTLYITGKGAIPNYSSATLGNRPWNGKTVYQLMIDKGVTSIGANAFYGFKDLYKVELYSTTFIEDSTAFAGATEDCIFNVLGMEMARRDIGNIPYTSLDQFVTSMQKYKYDYRFYFANYYVINYINKGSTPKWERVATMDALSTAQNPEYPLINYDSTITCNTPDGSYATKYSIDNYRQGKAALEAFAAFMGDNKYACTYTMAAYRGNTRNDKLSANPMQYTITIPNALKFPGRQFTLLQIGKGVVNVLPDLDASDDTMTFTTDYLSTGYALVYKDTFPY